MKFLLITLLTSAALSSASFAQDKDKKFDGLYLGAEVGVEEDFNNIYYGGLAGYRVQSDNNFVFGVEGTFGTYDTDTIDNIWSVGLQAGTVFGRDGKNLIYAGAGFTQLNSGFDDTLDGAKFSLGYERSLTDNIKFRLQPAWQTFGDEGDFFSVTSGFSFNF